MAQLIKAETHRIIKRIILEFCVPQYWKYSLCADDSKIGISIELKDYIS